MNQSGDIHPPRWPQRLLRMFLKKEYLEEIEGDMEEIFYDNVEQLSYRKARRIYIAEMLKLFRPVLLKHFRNIRVLNQLSMFKNYFTVSLRGLMRNPLNSFINVFGLAMAIGICIMGYGFARWTFSTDQFHEHKNEVHLVTFFTDRDGVQVQQGKTPRPLGEVLRQDFTHIKNVCRVDDRIVILKHNDDVYAEKVRFTDPSFLQMFTFPLKYGVSSSLSDINSIILSKDMSEKYFGFENPVGQTITMKFDKEHSKEFKVTGVAEKFPLAITIEFDFLVNFDNIKNTEPSYDFHDWSALVNATLIQVNKPADLETIAGGMEKYKSMQNKAVTEDWAASSFAFEPLATLHERASNIKDDISRSSANNYKSVIFMVILGATLLILACLNYINIAIVSAAKRLKEIGVRKSIGASRRVVIVQFLTENIVVTFFALIIGLFIGGIGFIPWFESLNDFDMGFSFTDPNLWIYLPAMLLITGIASGAYPAFYISRFQVVGIFRGTVKFGTKNPLTKIFLGVQLFLACIFITTAVMFTKNSDFLAARSWGYDQNGAIYARVPDQLTFEELQAVMSHNADVVSIAGSVQHVGRGHKTTVFHTPDHEYEADEFDVDPNYFQTLGIDLKEGRLFNPQEGSDRQAVVVNETFVNSMKWTDPTKQVFKIDSTQYEVIGVVKDFHANTFSTAIRPTLFRVASKSDYKFMSMKVRDGAQIQTYEALQSNWKQLFPELPFYGGFQEDVWPGYLEFVQVHGKVWRTMALVAVSLAALGLYGLMSLNVTSRVREFSIRKVLGAGVKSITGNITRQYLLLLAIALIAGAPVSYLLSNSILDMAYQYRMPMDSSGVIFSVALLLIVLFVTVSSQVRKIFRSNPVEGLKVE